MKGKKKLVLSFILLMTGLTLFPSPPEALAKSLYSIPKNEGEILLSPAMKTLKETEKAFVELSNRVKTSVVFISISKTVTAPDYFFLDPFEEFFRFGDPFRQRQGNQRQRKFEQQGVGSGFIIDVKKGYILTNNHVVGEADEISVKTHDGKTYEAKVIGTDPKTDVAVIQVKDLPASLGQIYMADSNKIEIGQWVIAVGSPHGLAQTVTRGIVSAKGRGSLNITGYGDFIQTDAAINPGNSGGPLINSDGDAIGMNTAIFSRTGGSQGIGFAIPSNILQEVAQRLINYGKIERAYLGVLIQPLSEDLATEFKVEPGQGALVSRVEEGSPAAKAGIQAGDVIIRVGDTVIKTVEQLSYKVGMSSPGSKVEVEFIRGGKKKTVQVALKAQPEEAPSEVNISQDQYWGMSLEPTSQNFPQGQQRGLLVTGLKEDSPAAAYGIKEGDIILEVNQKRVASLQDFRKFDTNKNKILFRIARGDLFLYIKVQR